VNKFRIKTRLITLVAVLLALVLLTSVMGTIRLRQANASIEIIYKDRLVGRGQLANLQIDEAQREYTKAHHRVERFMVVNGVVTGLTLCVAVLTCWMLIRLQARFRKRSRLRKPWHLAT
jgi:multidrug efflux pump subunit AcrB